MLLVYTAAGPLRVPASWDYWTWEGHHFKRGRKGVVLIRVGRSWRQAPWKYESEAA